MSQPFDLDAAIGAVAAKPFPFMWGGQQFELPALLDMPLESQLEAIELIEGISAGSVNAPDLMRVLRLIIGGDTIDRLNAAKQMSARAIVNLFSAWASDQSLGKSPESPASSASTAPPSKPTSRSARGRKTS